MLILGFRLSCPSVCPHELEHFISEKTELAERKERRRKREEIKGEEQRGATEIKQKPLWICY